MRSSPRAIALRLRPLVQGEVELEDVHARLAEEAEGAAVRIVVDQLEDVCERKAADPRDAGSLRTGVGARDVRVEARARGCDGVAGHVPVGAVLPAVGLRALAHL